MRDGTPGEGLALCAVLVTTVVVAAITRDSLAVYGVAACVAALARLK